MRKSARLAIVTAALAMVASPAGASPDAAPHPRDAVDWAQGDEAPALARRGDLRVGTAVIAITVASRPGLSAAGPSAADFSLPVRLFYPAAEGGRPAVYRHRLNLPRAAPYDLAAQGWAYEGAAPHPPGPYPLVVLSHGFGGWDTHMSQLCEVLASRGYVVAALDHGDARYNDVPGFLQSFGQVLLARPVDQRAAITELLARAEARDGALALVDPSRPIGLIGYSMGGYGALGTVGASYDPAAQPYAAMPAPLRDAVAAPSAVAAKVGAVALLAPWGAQPESRVWTAEALRRVTVPVLLVAGDQDDVVNYADAVRWLFEGLRGTERRLLTLHQARHNIAGNSIDLPPDASADLIGYFREPVWRHERLNQVLAHFLGAFLDANLKQDAGSRRYLDVPVSESNDGQWPVTLGELTGGTLSGDGQPNYWRGFARGWAVGMRLETRSKEE